MKTNIIHKLTSKGVQLKVIEGNLKINAPKGVLTKEFLEEIKANKAYLIDIISSNQAIPRAEIKNSYPLTPTQYFMWFTHEHLGGNRAYNITATLKLIGNLDVALLEKAFQQVISRHESLRTVFRKNQKDEIRQYIRTPEESVFKLEKVELDDTITKEQLHDSIKIEYQKVFDLEKDVLLSAKLMSVGTQDTKEHMLLFILHHIVGDGWSLQVLTKEVMVIYNSLVNNDKPYVGEHLPIQYKDYSEWLHKELVSDKYKNKLQYWKQQFETVSPVLELTQKKRPVRKTFNGRIYKYEFSPKLIEALNSFAKEHQMTLFMLLMGGLKGVFYRYTGQTDITLGTTVAGREHADLENQIGLYSNALAIRTRFEKEDTFLELIQKQRETLLQAYKNKEYPFTALVNKLSLPQHQDRSPLFDVMVLLQNHKSLDINDQKGVQEVSVVDYNEIETGVSQLDMSFVFVEKEKGLSLNVEYNTDIYEEDFIKNLIHHFETFITIGIERPESNINAIQILDAAEQHQILSEFNQPVLSIDPQRNVLDLIHAQAQMHPDHKAITYREEEVTYQELESYSNQLTNYLEKEFEIKKGDCIGIELHQTPWIIITIIAVLKSGGVYVPIDPNYPEKRKDYIQKDSKCKRVINSEIITAFKKQRHDLEDEYTSAIAQENIAYLIYTSGSTGNPKGVEISHKSLVDYAVTFKDYFQVTSNDSIVQQASISFDTSIEEIFPILISGGMLVIHEDKNNIEELLKLCEKYKITLLSTNPFVLQYLNQEYHRFSLNLRALVSGGDVLKPEYIDNLWDKIPVYNTYGPTESTVCCTYYKVEKLYTIIPIGTPIRNRQLFIVKNNPDSKQLAPVGVCGEICISGVGLAKGYFGRPELTKKSFVENPWQQGSHMYKTGDLGYWRSDGNIVFVGRGDSQVNLRGYRIELGEVEHAISKYEGISDATVLTKGNAEEKLIIAYIVGSEIDIDSLRSFLSGELPEYMVPNFFVQLAHMPLTLNGKIDKKKLLAIEAVAEKNEKYTAPKNDTEKELVKIWADILKLDTEVIGIEDNFFELGGHSLNVIKLLGIYEDKFETKISFKDFFTLPTLSKQAAYIQNFVPTGGVTIPKISQQAYYPLAPQQTRLWITSQFSKGNTTYNIPVSFYLNGDLDIDMLEKAFIMLIDRHEALRTKFLMIEEHPMQEIINAEEIKFAIERVDLSSEKDQEDAVHRLIREHHDFSFDLEKGDLMRVLIARLHSKQHLFLINMHHIISDGWSMGILTNEIQVLYNALLHNTIPQLPTLKIQYKDYASWQKDQIANTAGAKLVAYWKKRMGPSIPILDLPFDFARPQMVSFDGDSLRFTLPETSSEKLIQMAYDYKVTLFSVLFSVYAVFLNKITNQKSFIVGTSSAGRSNNELQELIGFFVNTLPIRFDLDLDKSYKSLSLATHKNLLEDYEHGDLPFDQLIGHLNIQRQSGVSSVFQTRFVYYEDQIFQEKDQNIISGVELEPIPSKHNNSKFELSTYIRKIGKQIQFEFEYRTDVFKQETIQHYANNMLFLIDNVIKTPELRIDQYSLGNKLQKENKKNKRKEALKSMGNHFKNF